ncbi:ORF R12 [Macacine gammaherpesvirus 5]|uniref:VIRF n=1 Tax=Rhesus monkey rhadinovirus H26-95 TaxID=69256 RepID=Q9J2J4_9GAMA|nr:vIRF [Rhesus monkey rhadinovirus H26-95]QFN51674.1 ORF R12 [Macacine gammaherpesvirus 5]QFN51766.1 ORF R12 [Macacine gammaherpesvirus 5]QFN51858.1 ORF R12 [Macacine gammaherpesvirus 5]QFQ66833.1 R9-7 vIRF [Macacine gammaherpesvirus 5]
MAEGRAGSIRVNRPSGLRAWLLDCCDNDKHPGMHWLDEEKTLVRLPWNHLKGAGGVSDDERNMYLDYCQFKGIRQTGNRRLSVRECKNWLASAIRHSQTVEDVSTEENLSAPAPNRCRVIRLLPIFVRSCPLCNEADATGGMLLDVRNEVTARFRYLGAGMEYEGAVGGDGEQCWMLRLVVYYYGRLVGNMEVGSPNGVRLLPAPKRPLQGHVCAGIRPEQALLPHTPQDMFPHQTSMLKWLGKEIIRGLMIYADGSGIYIRYMGHVPVFVLGNGGSLEPVDIINNARVLRVFSLAQYLSAVSATPPHGTRFPAAYASLHLGGVPTPEGEPCPTIPLSIQIWHECLWRACGDAAQ